MKLRWLAILSPLLLGLLLWATLTFGWNRVLIDDPALTNPRFTINVAGTLSNWFLLIGVVLSLILVGVEWRLRRWQRVFREERQRTSEERRRFVQRLDHELKNPLTAIRSGLANLPSPAGDTTQQSTVSMIESQTTRLSRLTSDLRKLADLEARSLERRQIDIGALLQEAVDLIGEKPEADERIITLTVPRAPWPLPTLMGDHDLLFLAFYNLLDNAMKFSSPQDTIEVRARDEGSSVTVEIADTGPGIDPADLPHIWEELYRGANRSNVPGSGLGLPLVRAILQRHQAQVAIKSRVGQGTVVTIRLPVK